MPAGRLREPPEALERADVIGIGVDDRQQLLRAREMIAARAGVERPSFGIRRRIQVDGADGSPVAVLSGIGRPDAFERQIADAGAAVEVSFRFPDHHRYTDGDVKWILEQAGVRGVGVVLTTEKDWAKLSRLDPPRGRFGLARLSLEFIDGNPLDYIKKATE